MKVISIFSISPSTKEGPLFPFALCTAQHHILKKSDMPSRALGDCCKVNYVKTINYATKNLSRDLNDI